MPTPYFEDDTVTLYHGDALDVSRALETGSVDCIVTSPPYFGLRDYGAAGQYGLEPSVMEYVETMRALFNELRRVLADDGTFWLNIGDTYSKKNLLGVPWRVAIALQDDGWILRNEVIWDKPNGVPESVTDRFAKKHEHLFLFVKSNRYHFDLDAVRAPHAASYLARPTGGGKRLGEANIGGDRRGAQTINPNPLGKNPGDVWCVATTPFKGAHFAVMPRELAERCIRAGSRQADTVLDPFSGSGTTGMVATDEGRKYVGIDISADYLKLSLETRLASGALAVA